MFTFISQISCSQEESVLSHEIDPQATSQAPWSIGEIVYQGNTSTTPPLPYDRKFLGITSQGDYLVQDFYQQSDTKFSDPFIIKNTPGQTVSFEDSSIEGKYIHWWQNGLKRSEGQYQNGKQQGRWTYWHDNGEKGNEGQYQEGKEQGPWTYWYKSGAKLCEGQLQDGQPQGPLICWHENGVKSGEGQFQDGKRQGLWIQWDLRGQKTIEIWYENGTEVRSQMY